MTKMFFKLSPFAVIAVSGVMSVALFAAPAVRAHEVHAELVSENPATASAQVPTPSFVSGGVGEEDRAELEKVQRNYSLKLVFAGEGGVFLDDIHVLIMDSANNTVLTTDTEGPILLAQLKPGKYVVNADVQGITQKQNVTIKKNRQSNITIRFPIGE